MTVINTLDNDIKKIQRLEVDLEVQGVKKAIEILEASNYDPNQAQMLQAISNVYDAVSDKYASALGIRHDPQVAKSLGYDAAWGENIRLNLFGEHSGVTPNNLAKIVSREGLSPSTITDVIKKAHENLFPRLRGSTLRSLLQDREGIAQEFTTLANQAGFQGNVDQRKLNEESVEALYRGLKGLEQKNAFRQLYSNLT